MQEQSSSEIWQVEVNGTIYEAPFYELGEWIDGGSLLPGDKIRKGNLRWIEARRVPSLLPFFNAKEKGLPMPVVVTTTQAAATTPTAVIESPAATEPVVQHAEPIPVVSTRSASPVNSSACMNHPDTESRFICDGCGVGLCRDCVKSYGGTVKACTACGSFCKPVTEAQAAKKNEARRMAGMSEGFGFGDFGNAIAYPFKFKTSLFFGAALYTMFSLGQSATAVGGVFMVAAALFCFMLANMLTFGVLANTVNNFIQGNLEENFMPNFDDFSLWDDVVHPFFLSIGIYVASFGPFLIVFVIGIYLVFTSIASQAHTVNSELEKIPGTQVYAGRKMADQSGDVKEVLNGIDQKQAERLASLTEAAETGNSNVSDMEQPVIDQESREQEELWAAATESRKQSLEATFGKTPETRAREQEEMVKSIFSLAAPLVVIGFLALIWGLFYFPAALAVAGYTKSFFATINPLVGLDTIRRLGFNYVKILFMGFLLLVVTAIFSGVTAVIFSPFDLPGMGNLIAKGFGGMFTFYISVVFSCILGYALFKSADKLQLLR